MSHPRVFRVADHLQPNDGEPIRAVVHATDDAAIVAWTVKPGQRISPHLHPSGQDTWTILAGEGEYQLDATGQTVRISAGDVVVAPTGAVHGVLNNGAQALVFVSVVSPANSGYQAPLIAPPDPSGGELLASNGRWPLLDSVVAMAPEWQFLKPHSPFKPC